MYQLFFWSILGATAFGLRFNTRPISLVLSKSTSKLFISDPKTSIVSPDIPLSADVTELPNTFSDAVGRVSFGYADVAIYFDRYSA